MIRLKLIEKIYNEIDKLYQDFKEKVNNKKFCNRKNLPNFTVSIEDEKRNEEICDYVVSVTNKDYESSVKEIEEILGI